MGVCRVDLGDGPRDVSVTRMTRTAWSAWLDIADEGEAEAALIEACTDEDPDVVLDEWPPDEALRLIDACRTASLPRDRSWAIARLEKDATLDVEMRVCADYGIPHSTFTGWSERDQDLAVAAYLRQADHCPGCGAPTAAQNDPSRARVHVTSCLMCVELSEKRKAVPEDKRDSTHLSIQTVQEDA